MCAESVPCHPKKQFPPGGPAAPTLHQLPLQRPHVKCRRLHSRFWGMELKHKPFIVISLHLDPDLTTQCQVISQVLSRLMHVTASRVGVVAYGETEGQKD